MPDGRTPAWPPWLTWPGRRPRLRTLFGRCTLAAIVAAALVALAAAPGAATVPATPLPPATCPATPGPPGLPRAVAVDAAQAAPLITLALAGVVGFPPPPLQLLLARTPPWAESCSRRPTPPPSSSPQAAPHPAKGPPSGAATPPLFPSLRLASHPSDSPPPPSAQRLRTAVLLLPTVTAACGFLRPRRRSCPTLKARAHTSALRLLALALVLMPHCCTAAPSPLPPNDRARQPGDEPPATAPEPARPDPTPATTPPPPPAPSPPLFWLLFESHDPGCRCAACDAAPLWWRWRSPLPDGLASLNLEPAEEGDWWSPVAHLFNEPGSRARFSTWPSDARSNYFSACLSDHAEREMHRGNEAARRSAQGRSRVAAAPVKTPPPPPRPPRPSRPPDGPSQPSRSQRRHLHSAAAAPAAASAVPQQTDLAPLSGFAPLQSPAPTTMASRLASPSLTWVPDSSQTVDRSDDPDEDPDSSLSQDHAGASSTDADSDQYDPDDLYGLSTSTTTSTSTASRTPSIYDNLQRSCVPPSYVRGTGANRYIRDSTHVLSPRSRALFVALYVLRRA